MSRKIKISFTLDEEDIAYFRAIYRAAKRNASPQDFGETERAVRVLITGVRETKRAPAFVLEAVTTLEDLLRLLDDSDYAAPATVRLAVTAALNYFANPHDAIPDDVPLVGFLDDAIMIKFVEEELKDELWGYRKFCKFRDGAEQRPWSDVAMKRLPGRLKTKRSEIRAAIKQRQAERSASDSGW